MSSRPEETAPQHRYDEFPEILNQARPVNTPFLTFSGVIDLYNRRLFGNPFHRT